MKKAEAIKLAGTAQAIADLLDITPSAVSQWPDDIPELRVYQIKALKPEWFSDKPPKKTEPAA